VVFQPVRAVRPSDEPVLFVGRDAVGAGLFGRQLVEVVRVVVHDPDAAVGVQLQVLVVVVLAAGVGRHSVVPTEACGDAPVAPHSQVANATGRRSAATLAQVHVCCDVEGLARLLRSVVISPASPWRRSPTEISLFADSQSHYRGVVVKLFSDSGNN
jgi:hypothetical protein